MALTLETAIQAIVDKAGSLASGSNAEGLIYLAKSLEALGGDSSTVAEAAIAAILARVDTLHTEASAEDVVYLAKAVEAVAGKTVVADLIAAGDAEIIRINNSFLEHVHANALLF